MNDATRRVTQWIIDIRGEVPLVEELATAEDVHSFVRFSCFEGDRVLDAARAGPAV
jgi:hypothetical protein